MLVKEAPDPKPTHFTNGFSIAIQIRWKFRFTLSSIIIRWSLQNFVHGTTAVLSWHVQKFVAIWLPATELQQGEVSIEFELRAISSNGPVTCGLHYKWQQLEYILLFYLIFFIWHSYVKWVNKGTYTCILWTSWLYICNITLRPSDAYVRQ